MTSAKIRLQGDMGRDKVSLDPGGDIQGQFGWRCNSAKAFKP